MTKLRWWACVVAGAGAVLAAGRLAAGDPPSAPASRSADTPAPPAPAKGRAQTGALDDFADALSAQRGPGAARRELFGKQSWAPPVSPPRPAALQPAPIARPPFPFVYAGRLKHGEAVQVYLARGAELVPI